MIVTVQLNVPYTVTVAPHAPIVAPAPIVVVMVAAEVKPVPVTPTDTPLGPWVGLTVMVGVRAGINPEELGEAGEGVGDGEETTTALEPLRETV